MSTEFSLAIRDSFPISEGHTLVVPITHVLSIYELREEELLDLSREVLNMVGGVFLFRMYPAWKKKLGLPEAMKEDSLEDEVDILLPFSVEGEPLMVGLRYDDSTQKVSLSAPFSGGDCSSPPRPS